MPEDDRGKRVLPGVPSAELVRAYVWELPVRVAHWLMFFSFVCLAFTGFYIHSPFLSPSRRFPFLMADIRFIHLLAGFVFMAAILLRIYWFFRGNFWARWTAIVPIHKYQWRGIWPMLEYYSFLRFEPPAGIGHNPLAGMGYVGIYSMAVLEILTGLAMYSQILGYPVLPALTGWAGVLLSYRFLREIHYFIMFIFFAFIIFHLYVCVLVSNEEESGLLDSIFSGWKFVPAWELRQEVQKIPEVRTFEERHEELPGAGPEEEFEPKEATEGEDQEQEEAVVARPAPTPVGLFRNWISYTGTLVAILGLFLFVALLLFDTFNRSRIHAPYSGLVIFGMVPGVVFGGVALILLGMFVQWIRWRSSKPLSFARYPEWDLNVPAQRTALLAVAIGGFILLVLSLAAGYQTYNYTESVPFCGSMCHSMAPEYATYTQSPHARVGCTECHVEPGPGGFTKAKTRGMVEMYKEVKNIYSRPIPAPVWAMRPIEADCEQCHWPQKFFGGQLQRKMYFMADEHNSPWQIDMNLNIGGGLPHNPRGTGIHWHVWNKVEYLATDGERQHIPWVRVVDPQTGVATVYNSTTDPLPKNASLKNEIRAMDCVDCHNRPTHILRSPSDSVDLALANGAIDSSLPFIKREGAQALAETYTDRDHALKAIGTRISSFYQKNYPQIYETRQGAIQAAVNELKQIYDRNYFPDMKVRWDTYADNVGHFTSPGCFRCHDGEHKSAEGKVISNDCNACHTILQQGKPNQLVVAKGPEGLAFNHPADTGGMWNQTPCLTCHTGVAP